MSVTDSKLELVELEDLDFERVCAPWSFDCGVKATWVLRRKCCWIEVPLCDEHKRIVAFSINESIFMHDTQTTCNACGSVVECNWENFEFVRL